MRRPNSVRMPKVASAALLLTAAFVPAIGNAQQASAPIGRTSAKEVNVSGAVEVRDGEMLLGNGSAITAGDQTVSIALTRGGELRLCSTTSVHLSHDRSLDAQSADAQASTGLMMALDRGAIEANYETGKYSDVLLTPDLRILISGPGHADLKIRVNGKGDTCIDNHGANAPYVTVSSQIDGGLYRIQPNQHVTLEHGSLRDVLDTETEPCGCPAAPVSVADSGSTAQHAAAPGKPAGGPSSTPADTQFPLAISEGLAPPPGLPTAPVAKPGEVHAQVTVPLSYNGSAAANGNSAADGNTAANGSPATGASASVPSGDAGAKTGAETLSPVPRNAALDNTGPAKTTPADAPSTRAAAAPPSPMPGRGLLHRIGRFFSKVFGNG